MITLTKRKFYCPICDAEKSHPLAIKYFHDVESFFPKEELEQRGITPDHLYTYDVIRENDVPVRKELHKIICDCGCEDITPIAPENFDNVMNFYPPSQNELWLRGFEGIGS